MEHAEDKRVPWGYAGLSPRGLFSVFLWRQRNTAAGGYTRKNLHYLSFCLG